MVPFNNFNCSTNIHWLLFTMVHTNNGTYTCLHNPWLLNISGHLLKSRMTGNVENE